jgi:hypothetical protein
MCPPFEENRNTIDIDSESPTPVGEIGYPGARHGFQEFSVAIRTMESIVTGDSFRS